MVFKRKEHYATRECQDITNLPELFCSISGTFASCHSQTSAFMHCYYVAVNRTITSHPQKVKQSYRKSLFALPALPASCPHSWEVAVNSSAPLPSCGAAATLTTETEEAACIFPTDKLSVPSMELHQT